MFDNDVYYVDYTINNYYSIREAVDNLWRLEVPCFPTNPFTRTCCICNTSSSCALSNSSL